MHARRQPHEAHVVDELFASRSIQATHECHRETQ